MREILFRGKRKDNGEWICGDLVHWWGRHNTKPDIQIYNNVQRFNVIPETIGQYTGLTDKNGKKIFEGDIVNFDGILYHIVFVSGCFRICKNNQFSYTLHNLYPSLEVIGNIHDNPELLKEHGK